MQEKNQGQVGKSPSKILTVTKWLSVLFLVAIVLFFILFNVSGQPFQWTVDARDWTGFGESNDSNILIVEEEINANGIKIPNKTITTKKRLQPAKTLWDWMTLLLAPATLATLGFVFQYSQEKAKRDKEETDQARQKAKEEADKARVSDQQREQALQTYFDQLSELLVDKKLRKAMDETTEQDNGGRINSEDMTKVSASKIDAAAALDVVKARTLSLLRMFDEDFPRKASILSFLADADLLLKLDLDLTAIRLPGANLKRVDFKRANLYNANLEGANLSKADLSEADLSFSNLSRAELVGANLSGAELENAICDRATLNKANFSRASLREADLSNSELFEANLSGAELYSANFDHANLRAADLTSAILSGANLSGADLFEANLSKADLLEANLSGANLSGTDLFEANLDNADLRDADLSETRSLTIEQIKQAKNWEKAKYDPEFRKQLGLPAKTNGSGKVRPKSADLN